MSSIKHSKGSMFLLSEEGKSFLETKGPLFKEGEFAGKAFVRKLRYRYFEPENQVSDKKYPLYVWLHGLTGRGFDNTKQISFGGNHHLPSWLVGPEVQGNAPGFVLAPQCPGGLFWVHFGLPRSAGPLRVAKDLVLDFIQNHAVDPSRVYCIGQSMGGFATWAMLAEFPGIFAAAVPLAGGGRPGKASIISRTPVWAFHGDKDNIVRVWRSRQMVKAIKRKSGEVRYSEIENGTHYIWPRVCSEPGLIDWLNSHQLKPEPAELLINS